MHLFCSDQIVNQVLDELGIQIGEELGKIPQATGSLVPPQGQKAQAQALSDADADLQARLENLRRE